ncbi:hypothetical protein [Micromonospora narathiwatensis]|uniref:Uncharacterized protein n=1 Tax=Micromonospora narathiwatensis TaxID=299146 RepID=A0A1A8ZIT3_9ACTN|nr:hypothetical protein [Micromonospora narathiwatensis]SBT43748.1 hypothetical protein GA0070621_1877 [Micromonospora narathiwatensis]
MRRGARRLLVLVTAAAALIGGLGLPARADNPVEYDQEALRVKLFGAHMRMYDRGLPGLKDLVLSDNLMYWRQQNPTATTDQLVRHAELVRQQLDEKLKGVDQNVANYYGFLKVLDAMAGIPGVSVGTPAIKAYLESSSGESYARWQNLTDAMTSSQETFSWMQRYYGLQDRVWGELGRRGQSDSALAAAWDGYFGSRLNVSVNASFDQLAADPGLTNWLNLHTILENQTNSAIYLQEVREAFQRALGQVDGKIDQLIAELGALSDKYPAVVGGPTPTAEDQAAAQAKAANFQAQIEAAGAAVSILSTLAGFVDPKLGRDIGLVGKAAISIASSVNSYLPTVVGLKLGQALTSASTLVLTGNIVGSVMTLLPMFTNDRSPDQLIMEQLAGLRTDIAQLQDRMTARFDRIETALLQMYGDMLVQFGRVFDEFQKVRDNLADIEHRLFLLDDKIDTFAAATQAALTSIATQDVRGNINRYVSYKENYGQDIPTYQEYTTPENSFHFTATGLSFDDTFTLPSSAFASADPSTVVNSYQPAGSINYLTWLAQRYDPTFPQLSGKVANPSVWALGARSYATLSLQNLDYAKRVSASRAQQVRNVGLEINRAAQAVSKPATDGGTNRLFRGLMDNYRGAVNNFSDELAKIRSVEVQDGRQYDLFGTPDQARQAAWPIPDAPTKGECNTPSGPTPVKSWPSSVRNNDLAPVYLLAAYVPKEDVAPTITWRCTAEVSVANKSDGFGKVYAATVTFTNYLNWPGEAPRPIRSRTFTYGPVDGMVGGVTFLNAYWDTIMAQPSWATTDAATLSNTKTRAQAVLNGKQKLYYDTVAARLTGAGALASANGKVTEAVKLLQAYSDLGWKVALQDDDLFNGLLNGGRHLPADIAGAAHFTEAYRVAAANYQACKPTTVGGACTGIPKHPFDDQPQYSYACPLDGNRLPGEPLGNCLVTVAQRRTDALGQRYALHSSELATGKYVESLPEVEALMTSVKLADLAVREG